MIKLLLLINPSWFKSLYLYMCYKITDENNFFIYYDKKIILRFKIYQSINIGINQL